MDAATAWSRVLSVRTPSDAAAAGLGQAPDGTWRWEGDAASPEAALLAELYAPLCLGGASQVVAQLGQSLDGFIATRTGDANFVTGEDDRRHLHRVRAIVDAVVIGAGTAVADDPQLTVRAVPGPNPVRVVVDLRGRVPPTHRLFTDGAAPTLWLTSDSTTIPAALEPHVEVVRLPAGGTAPAPLNSNHLEPPRSADAPGAEPAVFDRREVVRRRAADTGRLAPAQVLGALAERGLGRVLVEGGGLLVSAFLQARLLDRLYLTVAPVLIGDGVPGVRFPGTPLMRAAIRPPTRRYRLGDDVLFELDLRSCRP